MITRLRRRAFTLMEMVTSCVILSMIMLSLGYGLKLALVSTGNGASQAMSSLEASAVAEQVTDDLNEALNFTEKTPQAVTFTVPDRDATGGPETIRYAWWPNGGTIILPNTTVVSSGGLIGGLLGGLLGTVTGGTTGTTTLTVPQFAFTRQVNTGPTSVLSRDVRNFKLDYLYRTMAPAAATATNDRLLWQHDPIIGISKDYGIDSNKWVGETFVPQLPIGTTSWSITRIALYLKADSAIDGLVRMSLRAVNSSTNLPTAVTFDSTQFSEVSLNDSYGWYEFSFSNLNNLSPTTKYCILLDGTAGGNGNWSMANWMQTSLPASTTWLVQSTTHGATWLATTNLSSMRYKIYGTTVP